MNQDRLLFLRKKSIRISFREKGITLNAQSFILKHRTMANGDDHIRQLLDKLEALVQKQDSLHQEIEVLRNEIRSIQVTPKHETAPRDEKLPDAAKQHAFEKPVPEVQVKPPAPALQHHPAFEQAAVPAPDKPIKEKTDLEKFIGENLINKIGIAITVIGVAIGAKYAIDHDLISPLVRIILGYLVGAGLLGFAIRLKRDYENFSAVLLSGAMAIMYFITYAAYSFYALIPQGVTFALMVGITVCTVAAAIHYNKEVVAHIGLVGAYAVPFLLSEPPDNAQTLFTYTAIINAGILVLAFRKYWKPLYLTAFVLTWLMFYVWYSTSYQTDSHFNLALVFLPLFFGTFYIIFLAYKLVQKEEFEVLDVLLLLTNSFIFYGLGYSVLDGLETGKHMLGLFTLGNALVHSIIGMVIYRQRGPDMKLFYLVSGVALVFLTLAIPVQLDGNWVTLLWAGEAAVLFWIGRTKGALFYETLSYILMLMAFISLNEDWMQLYQAYLPETETARLLPLINIRFLGSALFIAAISFVFALHKKSSPFYPGLTNLITYSLAGILLYTLYSAFALEIGNYWDLKYAGSEIRVQEADKDYPLTHKDYDMLRYKTVWMINYALLFGAALALVNIRKYKHNILGIINLGFITLAILMFLMQGLYELSGLRESYLEQKLSEYYSRDAFHIGIRYVSLAFVAAAFLTCYRYIRQDFLGVNFHTAFDILLHISLVWIASSELITWMDMAHSTQSYKLGLSILWGVYSLLLIILGIWKKKKYLRIGAIVLFGITLIKLFAYDISHLDTISKTIVFVSLGTLLLVISFLYNKYKNAIADQP